MPKKINNDISVLSEQEKEGKRAPHLLPLSVLDHEQPGMIGRLPTMDQQESNIIAAIRAKKGNLLDR